jgi:hypothetical protein
MRRERRALSRLVRSGRSRGFSRGALPGQSWEHMGFRFSGLSLAAIYCGRLFLRQLLTRPTVVRGRVVACGVTAEARGAGALALYARYLSPLISHPQKRVPARAGLRRDVHVTRYPCGRGALPSGGSSRASWCRPQHSRIALKCDGRRMLASLRYGARYKQVVL